MDPEAFNQALEEVAAGDSAAIERLLPVVYRELRRLAAAHLRRERAGHTLQPTALVHEAYLRLAGSGGGGAKSRTQFLGLASHAMRHVLVDYARRRNAEKRGGGRERVLLDTAKLAEVAAPVAVEGLDGALDRLARLSERQARVVELRYFGGLSIEETAGALGVSAMTVKRDWALARAWLYRELSGSRD